MYLKTPVALFIGALFLSEKLSFAFYLGTSIILSTLFINQIIQPIGGKK
jgi:drug/metabolite transporter (DMT)-like permease